MPKRGNDNVSVPLGAWIPLPWKPKQVHTVVYSYACSHIIYKISCVFFDNILVDYLFYNGYI